MPTDSTTSSTSTTLVTRALNSALLEPTKLTDWVNSYKTNLPVNQTRGCVLSLNEVRNLMRDIDNHNKENPKQQIESIRIYLIKLAGLLYPHRSLNGEVGFAIVPDMIPGNIPLPWIVPVYTSKHSGMCPPNCGGI